MDELFGVEPEMVEVPYCEAIPAGPVAPMEQGYERRRVPAAWRADWVARVRGDSMEPGFRAGESQLAGAVANRLTGG